MSLIWFPYRSESYDRNDLFETTLEHLYREGRRLLPFQQKYFLEKYEKFDNATTDIRYWIDTGVSPEEMIM